MSYSPLVSYFNQSPNYDSRNGNKIQGFAIHCFVGQVGMPRGVDVFKPASKDASANYVIAYDGEIGAALQDEQRSWCTSSRGCDERVLSIECASDSTSPYAISDDCYKSLVALLVDRCKAYGIKRLAFANDADYARAFKFSEDYQNIAVHRWFANKVCPGEFIMNLLTSGKLCSDVNEILNGDKPAPTPPQPEPPGPEPQYTTTLTIRNLGIEDEGNDVVALQGILQANGYDLEWCGGADGIFGEGTENAVKEYQRDNGLDADGVVGPATWGSMLED